MSELELRTKRCTQKGGFLTFYYYPSQDSRNSITSQMCVLYTVKHGKGAQDKLVRYTTTFFS